MMGVKLKHISCEGPPEAHPEPLTLDKHLNFQLATPFMFHEFDVLIHGITPTLALQEAHPIGPGHIRPIDEFILMLLE